MFAVYRKFNDGTKLHHISEFATEAAAHSAANLMNINLPHASHIVVDLGSKAEAPSNSHMPSPPLTSMPSAATTTEDLWAQFRQALNEKAPSEAQPPEVVDTKPSILNRPEGEPFTGHVAMRIKGEGFELIVGDEESHITCPISVDQAVQLCHGISRAMKIILLRRMFGYYQEEDTNEDD